MCVAIDVCVGGWAVGGGLCIIFTDLYNREERGILCINSRGIKRDVLACAACNPNTIRTQSYCSDLYAMDFGIMFSGETAHFHTQDP